uniref:Nucleosome-remodeling factor subunit NURF301 n=1 Tax=Dracunculus medinensis TaxID=318479 RepID=A0A0N4U2G1_DRAME
LDSTPSTSACAHAEIPICPWIEIAAEKLPKLELPSSSCDLLIHSHYLFDALEVYETCRCYYRSVRISPFLFEDFCAALQAEEQTNLLAEIHIALLKLALKDDEDDQILLSVQDTNNSFNIMIQLIEPMTYAEVLRQYLESDPLRFPSEVLKAASGNYPFVSVKRRLIVLSWLCDRFLHSLEYKNIVRNEGKILSDEHCRECGKPGDVLLCDGCEACYHLQCANLLSVPDGEWFCQICILHQVRGVTGINSAEFKHLRQPLRLTPIGYDRHGRRYWFLVRRIFVEDDINGTVVYYSTLPQLYEVINLLAVDDFEKHLATAIFDRLHEISSQMRITMELTNERNQTKTDPYLVAENLRILNGILNKPFTEKPHNSSEEKINPVDSVRVVEISRPVLFSALEDVLGFRCGYLVDTFWSNGLSAENIRSKLENEEVQKTVASVIDGYKNILKLKRGFRIGDDRQVKQYDNQYSINDYAKRPHLRAKERDKKKYMCGRFSLADEHAFEWNIPKSFEHTNSMSSVGLVIQNTINKVATKIPSTLMHRLWRKDGLLQFRKYQTPIATIDTLKNALLVLECGIRRPALSSVWWGTLGHTRLIRITADDRERRLKMEQRKKKAERELLSADADEESDVIWVKYVRTRITHRHSLWRQKDEQFRINGRGALGGWLWVSSTLVRRFLPLPIKPTKEIYLIDQISEHTSIADKKAVRLETIIKKITNWRIAAELKSKFVCYSPSCRLEFSDICKHNRNISLRQCYSFFCRQKRAELDLHSEDVVHAYSPHIKEIEVDTELGLSKPFPFPTQHDFRVRRTGAQSLLVLPQRILKRLARQGGLNSSYVVPGFNRTAKSNSQDICVTIHHPDYDEVRNVIGHKEWPPDGSYEQYKLQVQLLPLDDSNDISEESGREEDQYRPSRQSDISRKYWSILLDMRKRKSTKHKVAGADGMNIYKKVKVIEKWIDGVDLKLWEIINYWKKVEQNANYPLMPVSHFSSRVSLNPLRSHVPYNNSPLINRKRILTKVFDGDYNCEVDDNEDEDDDDDDDEEGRSREKRRVTPMWYDLHHSFLKENSDLSNIFFIKFGDIILKSLWKFD